MFMLLTHIDKHDLYMQCMIYPGGVQWGNKSVVDPGGVKWGNKSVVDPGVVKWGNKSVVDPGGVKWGNYYPLWNPRNVLSSTRVKTTTLDILPISHCQD
jgi:hypothetical protein